MRLGLLLAVVAVGALSFAPRVADACSCSAHTRVTILPADRSERVHPQSNLFIVVSGTSGLQREAEQRKDYRLVREDQRDVPLNFTVEEVGNVVRIVPAGLLKENAWHRFEVAGTVLSRFQTGRSEALGTPPGNPEIVGVRQEPSRAGTPACEGRTHTVNVEVRDMGFDNSLATLFFWELSYQSGGRSIPLQVAPIVMHDRRQHVFRPNSLLSVGHGQCGCGPVFPKGNQFVRVTLVRVDGRRWESEQQNVFVN